MHSTRRRLHAIATAVLLHVPAQLTTLASQCVVQPSALRAVAKRAVGTTLTRRRRGTHADEATPESRLLSHPLLLVVLVLMPLVLFVASTAAAPTPTPTAAADSGGNPVCSTEKLPGMVEGFFQITTTVGILGFAVVLQIDTLIEIFNPPPETRQKLKRHKLAAAKSAGLLTLIGPLYAVAGPLMGLPLAPCLNLVPW